MAVTLKTGASLTLPQEGNKTLLLDDTGAPYLLLPNGSRESIGDTAWQTNAEFFVSPLGNNSRSGTGANVAKRTIYDGLEAIAAAGGGTLHIAEGCEIGGPVPGQGIRLRSDFYPAGNNFIDTPGFLPLVPTRLLAAGRHNGGNSFATGVQSRFGSDVINSVLNPYIWIAGSLVMDTLIVEGLRAHAAGGLIYRLGVDFIRSDDGTLLELQVANGTRTGTTTVYTVTLPSTLAVTHASRAANVTTLTIPNPGRPCPPWRSGVPVRFASGSGLFPSGDYVLGQDTSNPLAANTTWTISYPDVGADQANVPISGTIQTHGCRSGTLINLLGDGTPFRPTQYYVDSVTIDTITVPDVWGAGNADEDDIGYIAVQERMYQGTNNVQFKNCSGDIINSGGNLDGHTFDIGHTQAIRPIIEDCWFSGFVGAGSATRDERSMAAMYVYPGRTPNCGPAVAGVIVRDSAGTNGSIYVETDPDGVGLVDVRRTLVESAFLDLELPALRVDGNEYMAVVGEDIGNADAETDVPTVVLNKCQGSACHIVRSGFVHGPCVGGDMLQIPPAYVAAGANWQTPWARRQVTTWADGRITGKHPGVARAMPPVTARFPNLIAAPADWDLGVGVTLDENEPDPFGTNTGVTLNVTTQAYTVIRPNGTDGNTWEVGGKFFICGWINAHGASDLIPAEMFRVITGAVTFAESATGGIPTPYTGTGWQFVSGFLTVATVIDSTPTYSVNIILQSSAVCGLWGMTAHYIPPSLGDNDACEYMGVATSKPRYLRPGECGTMEGQPLFGHGGLGSGLALVEGVGAGQVTIAGSFSPKKYEPVLDAATGAIKGFVELLDGEINE